MTNQREIWTNLVSGPRSDFMLRKVMWRVVSGLSEITGRAISNDDPTVEKIPISQVPERAGGPEAQIVGIYVVIGGGLRGQAILILPMDSALNLADSMMGSQPGTATELGIMERSALSEIGNLMVSFFLNGVASLDEMPDMLRPSPPAVMVDMLGAILNVIITPIATVRDDLVVIETAFRDMRKTVHGRFWVLPDPAILDLGV
ncbi:MAG: chemotaxis protein CheC [Anaerolineae bacterium]